MNFTIVAVCNGRKETDSVKVKVKKKNEKTSPNQGGIGKFQMWREKMRARFSVARAQRRYQWASIRPDRISKSSYWTFLGGNS